ncbi:MAG: glycosyltransferase family 39 protein [Acidimicrobiales bacterium]
MSTVESESDVPAVDIVGSGFDAELPSRRRGLVAAIVPTTVLASHALRYGQWIVDDAGLTFAFARSLASGHGPRLQPDGPVVEAVSNPAWAGLLVLARWLGLFDRGTWFGVSDLVLFPKVLAVICCAASFVCMFLIARHVRPERATAVTVIAGSATACVPSFVIWCVSGLENSLFVLVVMALAVALVGASARSELLRGRTSVIVGSLVALAALTRPDGIAFVLAFPVLVVWAVGVPCRRAIRAIRAIVRTVGVTVALVAPFVVWRLLTFDRWLPNTAVAKQQGLPSIDDLRRVTDLMSYAGWAVVVLVVALAWPRVSDFRSAARPLVVLLGVSMSSYAVLRPDWMAELRFATAVWPLVSMLAGLSAAVVIDVRPARRLVPVAAVAAFVAVVTLSGWKERSDEFVSRPTVSICAVARNTGYTFDTYADRLGIVDGTLLAVDGGGTSLTSRLRFVDLSGLGDPTIADLWAEGDMAGLRDHVFDEVRPTFIRIWSGWDGIAPSQILADPRLQRDYVAVWAPPDGGGNWVRRSAVVDPAVLDALQRDAAHLAAIVDAPWPRSNTHWWCPGEMRPTEPADDPVSTLPV